MWAVCCGLTPYSWVGASFLQAVISVYDEKEEDSASRPLAARALKQLRVAVGALGAAVHNLGGDARRSRPSGACVRREERLFGSA